MTSSLLLRRVFWKKLSAANFCFLAFVSGWCFLALFRLCFCFIMWHCSPDNCQRILFLSRLFFGGNFRERAFGFFSFFVRLVFCVVVFLCFCFIMWHCSPKNCQKNSLLVRFAFWKKFSGANFWFLAFVSGWCFCCCFSYVFALFCGIVLPKIARNVLSLSDAHFGKISGANFWFLAFISGWCFCCFPMFLLQYVALFSRKLSEKYFLFRCVFWKQVSGTDFCF